jgi:hypothetical protein
MITDWWPFAVMMALVVTIILWAYLISNALV